MFETSCFGELQCVKCPLAELNSSDFSDQDRLDARNAVLLVAPEIGAKPYGADQYDVEQIDLLIKEAIKVRHESVALVARHAIMYRICNKCN